MQQLEKSFGRHCFLGVVSNTLYLSVSHCFFENHCSSSPSGEFHSFDQSSASLSSVVFFSFFGINKSLAVFISIRALDAVKIEKI